MNFEMGKPWSFLNIFITTTISIVFLPSAFISNSNWRADAKVLGQNSGILTNQKLQLQHLPQSPVATNGNDRTDNENNGNDLDSDFGEFYPAIDDAVPLVKGTGTKKSNLALGSNSATGTGTGTGLNNNATKQPPVKVVIDILRNLGYHMTDLDIVFLPKKSNSLNNSPENYSNLNLAGNLNRNSNGTAAAAAGDEALDNFSIEAYKRKLRVLLEKDKKDEKTMAKEVKALLRVIRSIEIDNFSECLKLITENYAQGFEGGNRTRLLIAMVQAAAEQWGGVDETGLPPPFGSLSSSHDGSSLSPELRDELLDLSDLLTVELKDKLVAILSRDLNKSQDEIRMEMATVEENENGGAKMTVGNRMWNRSSTVVDLRNNSSKTKRHDDSSHADDTHEQIIVEKHEENEIDGDDFTIIEDIIFDKEPPPPPSEKTAIKKVQRRRESSHDEADISSSHLESIIRRDQRLKSSANNKRESPDPEENTNLEIDTKNFQNQKSFSRHKRV